MSAPQTQTPRLGLPLLAGGQAQKHIVVNDALLDIDHFVQARLSSRTVAAQPTTPEDGDIYMIPVGASGPNWSAFAAGQVVRFFDGFWYALSYPEGTLIYVSDENLYLCKSNAGWVRLDGLMTELQNLSRLGIGTVADSTNPISAYLNSVLLAARSVGDGGTGDLRLTLNKSTSGNTASVIFKDGFSARAEIGLLGTDSFGLKVTNDGATWVEAFTVTAAGLLGIGTTAPSKKLEVVGSDALINGITLGRGAGDVSNNAVVGNQALASNTTGGANVALGYQAANLNQSGNNSVAIGYRALASNVSGAGNIAIGRQALELNTVPSMVAIGHQALGVNTTGGYCTALGYQALGGNTTGANNTGIGFRALVANTTAVNNTAIGFQALSAVTSGNANTALGRDAGSSNITYSNTTCLGYQAQVTGADQVQLGNSTTTTYVYGTVQNRSDVRDKADVRDTLLGLDFILGLRPVDYRLDLREDYRTAQPPMPQDGADEAQVAAYHAAFAQWQIDNRLGNIVHDGSHKRTRYHSGLIAQEVAAVIEQMGINWGGVQDHSHNGGDEVMSLGYSQFIAPLIRAVQQLTERVTVLEGGAA